MTGALRAGPILAAWLSDRASTGASVSDLSDAARLALWFTAWRRGDASLDEARDAIVGEDAAHDVVGLAPDPMPLILAFGALAGRGASAAGLALPVPGDPLGLAGPPDFNAEALEQEEAVVLVGLDLGLLPYRAGRGVQWRAHLATSLRQVPDLSEADGLLRRALLHAADALAELDVARWRPDVADALLDLRRARRLDLPDGLPDRVDRMLDLAGRCRDIVAVALEDDGGAVTASEAERRRQALEPLDHAARRALVAACSFTGSG